MPPEDDPDDTGEPNYVATFDPNAGERPTEAVLTAVAALVDARPADLAPLYEAVDPDALDALVDHARRTGAGPYELRFTYEGFDVGVQSDGRILIKPASVATNPDLE